MYRYNLSFTSFEFTDQSGSAQRLLVVSQTCCETSLIAEITELKPRETAKHMVCVEMRCHQANPTTGTTPSSWYHHGMIKARSQHVSHVFLS